MLEFPASNAGNPYTVRTPLMSGKKWRAGRPLDADPSYVVTTEARPPAQNGNADHRKTNAFFSSLAERKRKEKSLGYRAVLYRI